MSLPSIGAVVLTYNSASELRECLNSLALQADVDLRVIVVDNASDPGNRAAMEAQFLATYGGGSIVDERASKLSAPIFIRNSANIGYSAGNNVGAKLAVRMGCESILIMNPDVRLTDPHYLRSLSERLRSAPEVAIVATSMRDLHGRNENPMAELSFWREFLMPMELVATWLGLPWWRHKAKIAPNGQVEKVSGCCFLVRSSFLENEGYLDEGLFLYCEESVLAARVRHAGMRIIYCDDLEAVHAHAASNKGSAYRRFRYWSKSRAYFHRRYTKYSWGARTALAASRKVSLLLFFVRSMVKGVGN